MYEEDSFGVGDNGSDAEQNESDLASQPASETEAPSEDSLALEVEQTEQAPDEAQTPEAVEPEDDYLGLKSMGRALNALQAAATPDELIQAGQNYIQASDSAINLIQAESEEPEQLSYAEILQLLTEREIEREQLRQQLEHKDRYYNELLEAAEGYIAEIKELQQPSRLYHDRVEQLLRNLAPSSPDGEEDAREPAEIDQAHQVVSNALRHAIAILGRQMSHFGSAGSLNFLPDHPVRKDAEYLLEWLTCPPIDKALAPEVRRRATAEVN